MALVLASVRDRVDALSADTQAEIQRLSAIASRPTIGQWNSKPALIRYSQSLEQILAWNDELTDQGALPACAHGQALAQRARQLDGLCRDLMTLVGQFIGLYC